MSTRMQPADGAFDSCTRLVNVTLGNNVTWIGQYLFSRCTSLRTVTFAPRIHPGTVQHPPSSMPSCLGVGLQTPNANTSNPNGSVFPRTVHCLACTGPSLVIPHGVVAIPDFAFTNCSFETVSLPSTLTSLGVAAFGNSAMLTTVTTPMAITSIGQSAFVGCTRLGSVSILGRVAVLPDKVFLGCSALTAVSLPNSLTTLG
eukprot:m.204241 g.204241  ORF g.204241 m.204241 type:complete len:201 (-) comp25310_c0_seq1:2054-2656(-)